MHRPAVNAPALFEDENEPLPLVRCRLDILGYILERNGEPVFLVQPVFADHDRICRKRRNHQQDACQRNQMSHHRSSSYPIVENAGNVSSSHCAICDICPVMNSIPVMTSNAPIAFSTLPICCLKRFAQPMNRLANTAAAINGRPMPSE